LRDMLGEEQQHLVLADVDVAGPVLPGDVGAGVVAAGANERQGRGDTNHGIKVLDGNGRQIRQRAAQSEDERRPRLRIGFRCPSPRQRCRREVVGDRMTQRVRRCRTYPGVIVVEKVRDAGRVIPDRSADDGHLGKSR